MAGRPRLRIGDHGKIKRINLGGGIWLARCRYRDLDGVTRRAQCRGPDGVTDQYGKLAEEALLEALTARRPPGGGDLTLDTPVMGLVGQHIDRLEADGRAIRTIDSYRYDAQRLGKFMAGVRVGEATAGRIDAVLRSIKAEHGAITARRSRTILRGGLQLAVLAEVLGRNPVNDVGAIKSTAPQQGAPALTADQLHELFARLEASEYCQKADLVDPITVLIATGLRRGELLGLRWRDFNAAAATLTVVGEVVRKKGEGLRWQDKPKTDRSRRTVPLAPFAVAALSARRIKPFIGDRQTIFASTAGTLRDPDNFNKQWGKGREDLSFPDVSSHTFRKSIGTIIGDHGVPVRLISDTLGHARVSMTHDRYMARGGVHTAVADIMENVIKDE